MAGIKDLLSLFHWIDNQQDYLLEASMTNPEQKDPSPGPATLPMPEQASSKPAKKKVAKKS